MLDRNKPRSEAAQLIADAFDAGCARYKLSQREREVMWYAFSSNTCEETASILYVARSTVISHIKKVGIKVSAGKQTASIARLLGIRD